MSTQRGKNAPITEEIAPTVGGMDITRGYLTETMLQASQDEVLETRGGGDLRLYQEVLRDDQVYATLRARHDAVIAAESDVEAGGTRARDKKAADSLRAQLDAIGWDDITRMMLFGEFYGLSAAEMMWARDGREVFIEAIRVRNRRRFAFDGAGRLRLRTMTNLQGMLLPKRKMWAFSCGADNSDEPYGVGLAHWLYWPVFFKRNGLKLWLIFLDKFGQPTPHGEYPPGTGVTEKNKLGQALAAIQTSSWVMTPEGMKINLLEAARSGTGSYDAIYDRMDKAISKIILGHTAASDSTPGKLGSETLAEQVRGDIIEASARLVCESFNRGPARWLTEWNFPGAAAPRVFRRTEQGEDLNALAKRDQVLSDIGFRPTLQYVTETYDGEYEPVPPRARATVLQAPTPEFAEGGESSPTVTDRMSEKLDNLLMPTMDTWIDRIKALVDSADSLEAIRDGLLELYPDLSPDQFTAAMSQALEAATLAGRYDVMEQANGGG